MKPSLNWVLSSVLTLVLNSVWALLLSGITAYTNASDVEREKRLADQALATLFTGEPVMLKAKQLEFLALETEPDASVSKGAVILLHGRGLHPDSTIVVGPLRQTLAQDGWHTLSIQLPVLEKGKKYYDYVDVFPQALPRIDAAIEYLKDDHEKIMLLAHSCGVHMSMAWLRHRAHTDIDTDIHAYIGIGMGATDYQQAMRQPFPFTQMKMPVLDIFGAADYPAVIRTAGQRWQQISDAGNKHSKQLSIDAADHNFEDQEDALFEAISEWLHTLR